MNNSELNIVSINFFNKGLIPHERDRIDFKTINKVALKYGYLIHPECCSKYMYDWFKTLTTDYNATFYKEWNDVISKSRFELYIDQMMHYITTYGTNFEIDGNGYVPNDREFEPIHFNELKVISPISKSEIYVRFLEMLESGIAMKSDNVTMMCDFIIENSHHSLSISELDRIKNREAQAYLCAKLGMYPSDKFAILRCLIYQYTKSMMLIKNKSTIQTIKTHAYIFDRLFDDNHPLLRLSNENLKEISKIFYRFKPLFLAMKTARTASTINKLRKLAKITHEPLTIGFWENLIFQKRDINMVSNKLKEIDNFKKVKLLQAVKIALYSEEKSKVYNIRNGKVFTRMNYKPSYDKNYLMSLESVIYSSLIDSLKGKACKFYIPENVNITLPSSEKSFIGNYPFGSNIHFDKNAVVGIFWKNEWGTHDFDLSFIAINGHRIGWNASYYWNARFYSTSNNGKDIIYSGDMTNANPHAVETMYIPDGCCDSIVCVNQYHGNPISKFRFFVAEEKMDFKDIHGKMVDSNNIKLDTMIDVKNEAQKDVGLIHDNTLYLMDLHSGNNIVSSYSKGKTEFINTISERTKYYVYLKNILLGAGFTMVDNEEDADISFKDLNKDTLIKLLSNER